MNNSTTPPVNDYLKYWRVIRYFIKEKYNLSLSQLEMLLFLYSEDVFSTEKFAEFNQLMSWDKKRFYKLKKQGWIELFRPKTSRKKPLYQLSYKAQRVVNSVYKKLSGEEIPTSPGISPMFARNVKYSDKVYKNMIFTMNRFIKQQRHPFLEL